ncbi:MAG: hypothetical protein QXS81_01095 [Candidatus Micrarchaeaceae archaeon]
MIPKELADEIAKAVKNGGIKHAKELESMELSKEAKHELYEDAKKNKADLLHQIMLDDFIATTDGVFLRRPPGHITYDEFIGVPNLNKTVLDRMRTEIDRLTPPTRFEVMVKLATKFPSIAEKINDVYVKYGNKNKRLRS